MASVNRNPSHLHWQVLVFLHLKYCREILCYTVVSDASTYTLCSVFCLAGLDTFKGPLSASSVNELISLWMRKTHRPYRDVWGRLK